MNSGWHVASTTAGAARLVMARVHSRLLGDPPTGWIERSVIAPNLELYLPLEEIRTVRRGIVKYHRWPMFGAYAFCRFDDEMRAWLLKQSGVRDILPGRPIPDHLLADVRALENAKGVVPVSTSKPIFEEGANVRICDGPLSGFEGAVERPGGRLVEHVDWRGVKRTERVATARVRVAMFGRDTAMEMVESQLEAT